LNPVLDSSLTDIWPPAGDEEPTPFCFSPD